MKTIYMKPAIKIKYIETEGDLLATSNNNFVQTNAGYGGYVGDVDSPQIGGESELSKQRSFPDKWNDGE